MDNLSFFSNKKNFIAKEDDMSVSTFGIKSFYGDKVSFDLDLEKKKKEMLPLYLDNSSTSQKESNHTAQTTNRAKDKTQEAVVQDR